MSLYKGTNLISGHQVLYSTTGSNTDGAMTQKAVTNIIKYSNVAKVGSIIDTDHVLSGFSSTNYAIIPNTFAVSSANSWEIVFKVTTGGDIATQQYFIGGGGVGSSYEPIIIGINNNVFVTYMNTANSSGNQLVITTSYTPTTNTTYIIKLEFTGSEYNFYVDGTLEGTLTSSTKLWGAGLIIGAQNGTGGVLTLPWLGTVDLKDSYININGDRWWTGTAIANDFNKIITSTPLNGAVDGQWVTADVRIASSQSLTGTTDVTYDLSDYLPQDGYNYEIIITTSCNTGSTSGNNTAVSITTDIMTHYFNICSTVTRTSSSMSAMGTVSIAIGTSRRLYLYRAADIEGTCSLYFRGYRRLGTNS